MDKYFYTYYAVLFENFEGEHSSAIRVRNSNNLMSVFKFLESSGAKAISACRTIKEAEATADFWNTCSLENGKYALSNNKVYPAHIYDFRY